MKLIKYRVGIYNFWNVISNNKKNMTFKKEWLGLHECLVFFLKFILFELIHFKNANASKIWLLFSIF